MLSIVEYHALQRFGAEIDPGAQGMRVLPPWVLHPHECCIVSATKSARARRG